MKRELSFAAVIMVWATIGLFTMPQVEHATAIAQSKDNMAQSDVMRNYIGASSCGVLGVCHGSTSARKEYNVNQNEHYIWLKKDRHAAAYDVLLRPWSVTIAKNLNLPEKAEKSSKCLTCHALAIPASQQSEKFQLEDGVSCEACHGPAESWVIEHTRTGDEGYQQAVALRESVQRLARRGQQENAPGWPEFAEFDCFACHREVRNVGSTYFSRDERDFLKKGEEWPPSWRQRRGYDGVAGIPRWDASQYVVFRELVKAVAPEARQTLDEKMAVLGQLMGKISAADPKKISVAATDAAAFVDTLIPLVTDVKPNAQLLDQLLQNIADASPEIASAGFRVAGQAAMAVDALFVDYRKHVQPDPSGTIDEAIDKLFESLEKPETYVPEPFQKRLEAVQSLIAK